MDDDGAVIGRDLAHGAVHLVPVAERAAGVRRGAVVIGQEADVGRMTALPPALVEARIHQQPSQPGIKPMRVTQRAHVAPGSDEGVLDRVLGAAPVPKDEGRGREHAVDPRCRQSGERLPISVGRRANHGFYRQELLSPRTASVQGMAWRRGIGFSPQ